MTRLAGDTGHSVAAHQTMGRAQQVLWGSLGGLTPSIVVVVNRCLNHGLDGDLPKFGLAFLLLAALRVGLGVLGSILLESHSKFTAYYHGGTFPVMLNFLFGEVVHQAGAAFLILPVF